MSKNVKDVRQKFFSEFSNRANVQVLDCGTAIESDYKIDGKAEQLFRLIKGRQLSWTCDLADLISNKWYKWNSNASKFQASDILSISDVKKCIKYYYLQVSNGKLSFKDGSKRMLTLTIESINDGKEITDFKDDEEILRNAKISLNVVEFKEIYKIVEPKTKEVDILKMMSKVFSKAIEENQDHEKALNTLFTELEENYLKIVTTKVVEK